MGLRRLGLASALGQLSWNDVDLLKTSSAVEKGIHSNDRMADSGQKEALEAMVESIPCASTRPSR